MNPVEKEYQRHRQYGMIVHKGKTGKDLQFEKDMTEEEVDQWLRELFPLPFEFLDLMYPNDIDQGLRHWALLEKHRFKITVVQCKSTDGRELSSSKGNGSRPWAEYAVRFGESLQLTTIAITFFTSSQ